MHEGVESFLSALSQGSVWSQQKFLGANKLLLEETPELRTQLDL
jgi:hypothetical protein